jgi:hypothetical protein
LRDASEREDRVIVNPVKKQFDAKHSGSSPDSLLVGCIATTLDDKFGSVGAQVVIKEILEGVYVRC